MNECLFCGIAGRTVPSEVVYEGDEVVAFKDIRPKAPVHLLIVPKMHIESIAHLEENHTGIIAKLIYTAKNIAASQGLQGYRLVFNVGRDGGQVVDHLHLHLLGGWTGEEETEFSSK